MQRSLELSEAELLMNGLALSVRDQGQPLLVKQLPDPNYTTAWMQQLHELNIQVQADPPVFISASGFCPFGGEIVIELKGRTYSAYLAPPACQLQWSFPDA
ncbi:hypothetical protein [Nitrincola tapanii]|nr:hypothetical protein [Nitrincola tapanii]